MTATVDAGTLSFVAHVPKTTKKVVNVTAGAAPVRSSDGKQWLLVVTLIRKK